MILALNETRKTLLASRVEVARDPKVALGRIVPTLHPGEGLWVVEGTSVDGASFETPIDVLFVDRDGVILETVVALRPKDRERAVPGTHGILLLPPATISATGTRKGDRLSIEPIGGPASKGPSASPRAQMLACGRHR